MPRKRAAAPPRNIPRGYGYLEVVRASDGLHKVQARWRDGKRYRAKTFTAATEQAARDAATDHLVSIHRERRDGRYVAPSLMTVSDAVEAYIERLRDDVSPATYGLYKRWAGAWITAQIGGQRLTALTTHRLQHWIDGLRSDGLSPRTIQSAASILSWVLTDAVRKKIISESPMPGVTLPTIKRTAHATWSRDEIATVLAHVAVDPYRHAWYQTALMTGMRPGELRALQWRDVDLETGVVTVRRTMTHDAAGRTQVGTRTKTGDVRTIRMPSPCVTALRTLHASQRSSKVVDLAGYVFALRPGEPVSSGYVRKLHQAVIAETGVTPITPHGTRHTFATILMEANTHVSIVSMMLGHKHPSITLGTYTHPTVTMQGSAVDVFEAMQGATTQAPDAGDAGAKTS